MPIRDNKLARSSQKRAKPNSVQNDNQPTVDDQLTRLEEDMRRLKIEYDIYFNGASKRPPYDTKSRVETVIKRLGDDRALTFAQRYRLNSLTARYNAFRELWRRTLQGREEGRDAATAARAAVRHAGERSQSRGAIDFRLRGRARRCPDRQGDIRSPRRSQTQMRRAHRRSLVSRAFIA